jgi:hypothetical protein
MLCSFSSHCSSCGGSDHVSYVDEHEQVRRLSILLEELLSSRRSLHLGRSFRCFAVKLVGYDLESTFSSSQVLKFVRAVYAV